MNNEIYLKRKIAELEMRIEQLESQLTVSQSAGNKPYYSVAEYAKIMSVTPQTVYNRIHTGDILAVKVGKCLRIPLKSN